MPKDYPRPQRSKSPPWPTPLREGKKEEAERRFEKALSLAKNKVEKARLFYNWASVLEQEGLLEDTEKRFKEVLNLIPSLASFEENNLVGNAHFHLGCIYQKMGETKRAKQHFEKCLKLIPDHKKARENLERIPGIKEVSER